MFPRDLNRKWDTLLADTNERLAAAAKISGGSKIVKAEDAVALLEAVIRPFDRVNIDKANTRVPSGVAADVEKECAEYDAALAAAGGADVQVLGIGGNGHIGFNEPDGFFTAATHKVALTENTIKANARFFASEDEVPRFAVTMGMGAIMSAKSIVLVANGEAKAQAVASMLTGGVDPLCPASILQLHPDVHVFIDKDAAKLL